MISFKDQQSFTQSDVNNLWHSILNCIPSCMVIITPDAKALFCNKAFEHFIGFNNIEDVELNFLNLIWDKDQQQQFSSALKQLDSSLKLNDLHLTLLTKSDEKVRVKCSLCLLDHSLLNGKYIMITLLEESPSSSDSQLKADKKAMVSEIKAKSKYLANLSHEIRTPLSAITGFAELLTHENLSKTERMSYIESIKRNGKHLTALVNDILDISKIEAGEMKIVKSRVDLEEELNSVFSVVKNKAIENNNSWQVQFIDLIPKFILTDAVRLRQILINLLFNALKYTENGIVKVSLNFKIAADVKQSSELEFLICDTGCGIDSKIADTIFLQYNQVQDPDLPQHQGTGLGLALSKQLAQLLGGDVTLVESVIGKGSIFKFVLDVGNVEGVPLLSNFLEVEQKIAEPTLIYADQLNGLKILIVEDGKDNQILFQHILERAGANILLANNGKEGVAAASSHDLDVVIMDIQMPELNGYDAVAKIRQKNISTPVIALTAHASKEEKHKCLACGFNDYRSKPIEALDLINVVALWSDKQSQVALLN